MQLAVWLTISLYMAGAQSGHDPSEREYRSKASLGELFARGSQLARRAAGKLVVVVD